MKQVLQHRKQGDVRIHDVPLPQLRAGGVLVQSRASLISAGTEKAGIELTQQSLIGMAQERPDLVRRVLDKVQKDGILATWGAVRDQLDRHVPLGYSCAGAVAARSPEVSEFEVGQLVACAGAGYACHAEVNFIPRLLAAAVPAGVSAEQGAYATVGSIALQGIRNAQVQVGETVAVIGLGLIGQLASQILRSAGCRVIGFDVSPARATLAMEQGALAAFGALGAKEAAETARLTRGRGVDAVLICAATKSNNPIEFAANISRDRGKVVMVGVTGMDVPRNDYYHKELTLVVSRSYGPGRYDAAYEEQGHDYPAGYVRWTEQRNLEAFLDLVAAGSVKPELFTTHRFPVADAEAAYKLILEGSEPYLGVVLDYPAPAPSVGTASDRPPGTRISLAAATRTTAAAGTTGISFIGVGNFARGTLLPHLQRIAGVRREGLLSASGHSAATTGEKFGFRYCTSRLQDILDDDATDAVFVATRHSQHAELACQAVAAGKTVFTEKPLAVDLDQLQLLTRVASETGGRVMAGFNRRFAPLAIRLKEHFAGAGPLTMHYRVSAGPLPHGHWLASPEEGGRIVGEGCHFFDLLAFLCGARPKSVYATSVGAPAAAGLSDDLDVMVTYEDGSIGHLTYCTTGASATAKERVEVFGGGLSGLLDDFRRLELHRGSRRKVYGGGWSRQDKGHRAELEAFLASLRTGSPLPIAWESQVDTTLTTFASLEGAAAGRPILLDELRARLSSIDLPGSFLSND